MSQSEKTDGWTYHEAGVDTIADVAPVGDPKELQKLLETCADDAAGEKTDAYEEAAELVEAHRIRKMHQDLNEGIDARGNFALMWSLFLAGGAGAILPFPSVAADAGLGTVFSAILDSIVSVEYALAFVLFAAAVVLQLYGSYRLERGAIGQ